jgi:hypothetical protein
MVLLQIRALKADSEKRLRNFFEPLLLRLQPSASKMLREEVLNSVVNMHKVYGSTSPQFLYLSFVLRWIVSNISALSSWRLSLYPLDIMPVGHSTYLDKTQLLSVWILPMSFLCLNYNISETEFCLHLHVDLKQLGPLNKMSPPLRT